MAPGMFDKQAEESEGDQNMPDDFGFGFERKEDDDEGDQNLNTGAPKEIKMGLEEEDDDDGEYVQLIKDSTMKTTQQKTQQQTKTKTASQMKTSQTKS